jgi:hypothetical protein
VTTASATGIALDVKNQICSRHAPRWVRRRRAERREPLRLHHRPRQIRAPNRRRRLCILSAKDGKVLARLPLAGSSDGAYFNAATMEAFSSQGNGTMTIIKEKSPDEF